MYIGPSEHSIWINPPTNNCQKWCHFLEGFGHLNLDEQTTTLTRIRYMDWFGLEDLSVLMNPTGQKYNGIIPYNEKLIKTKTFRVLKSIRLIQIYLEAYIHAFYHSDSYNMMNGLTWSFISHVFCSKVVLRRGRFRHSIPQPLKAVQVKPERDKEIT